MQKIGSVDAKTRLGDLLDRTAHGETFLITDDGKPVAQLVPASPNSQQREEGLAALLSLRGTIRGMRVAELKADAHEDHRH